MLAVGHSVNLSVQLMWIAFVIEQNEDKIIQQLFEQFSLEWQFALINSPAVQLGVSLSRRISEVVQDSTKVTINH